MCYKSCKLEEKYMKNFYRRILPVVQLLLLTSAIYAQANLNISVPYSFSFEESEAAELANWVINPGKIDTLKEKWVIGPAAHSDGKQSLYISNDGLTDTFGIATVTQYVYRDILLPKGTYECTFDWRCMGGPNSSLYAGVYDKLTVENLMLNAESAKIPDVVARGCSNETSGMRGSVRWQNASFKISSNGSRVIRLYFIWSSNNSEYYPQPISACIDNIQIVSANCSKPKNMDVQLAGDSIYVSWVGTSEKYIFEYRKSGRNVWNVTTGLTTEQYIIENPDEGFYDMRVRGVCNDVDTSAYLYKNSFLVYYPERHCIDFVHLENNPNIEAEHGTFSVNYTTHDITYKNMEFGVVDNGSDAVTSLHTINNELDVYDPRTGYRLSTIPPSGYASVRLGNWNSGSGVDRITFSYTVDESSAILLMHYAIVLQDPDHDEWEQPRFTLEILDEWDELINPSCGYADFYADIEREGWHAYGSQVTWKDWTTIGLNLSDRVGETIRIRVTSYDCSLGGHYGYAYFALDCAAAKITGTSCGDDAQLSIAAPEGFSYEWFDKYDSPVPSDHLSNDGRTLMVDASDTTTYRCHLTFLEEQSCGFDLYSAALPRFPISSFEWEYVPQECQNRVRFTNKSHIMTKFNNVIEYHYDQQCDDYEWSFGTGQVGSTRNPIFVFPNEGGTYDVTLFASIAEGRCVDDTTITITLPAIGDKEVHVDTTMCDGDYLVFGPQYIGKEGEFFNTWKTSVGCDSLVYLNVKMNPRDTTYLPDTTICAEEPLYYDGQRYKYTESGKFVIYHKNRFMCDSTLFMNVTVMDSIKPVIDVKEVTSELNSGAIVLGGTGYDYYVVNGEKNGALTGLNGGMFELEFFNDFGCSVSDTVIMNYECLGVKEVDRDFACMDDDVMQIRFVKDSGILTDYKLQFSEQAKSAGLKDTEGTLTYLRDGEQFGIDIDISQVTTPGIYDMVVVFTDPLCQDVEIPLSLQINFSADILFQRWGDVLSVKKPSMMGGEYDIIGFRWVKNGEVIAGEDKSYYYAEGGLDADALYQVELIMSDSTVLTTCAIEAEEYVENIEVRPTKARVGEQIEVVMPQNGSYKCYSPSGVLASSGELTTGTNYYKVPSSQGVYMLGIETSEGVKTVMISVTE